MNLGPRFWYHATDRPALRLNVNDRERLARMREDQRQMSVWQLGGILHDASREDRIRAKQDWPYLCVKASAFEREIYEGINGREKALDDIVGYGPSGVFRVGRDTLLKLWRADSRRVES